MTTTRTKHAGGTAVEVFDFTPFGFMGFNTNPLRQDFGDPWHLYGGSSVNTDFVTTWQATSGQTLTIPTTGTGYDVQAEWYDSGGSLLFVAAFLDANMAGATTPAFSTTEVVTCKISGDFPRIYFNNGGDKTKILTVENWGDVGATQGAFAFWGCSNLTSVAPNGWANLAGVARMFQSTNLSEAPSKLFNGTTGSANRALNCAAGSLVTLNTDTFYDCDGITDMSFLMPDSDISEIPVGFFDECAGVTTLEQAFIRCNFLVTLPANLCAQMLSLASVKSAFQQCGTSGTLSVGSGLFTSNTSLADLTNCFWGCSSLTDLPNAGDWPIANVTTMTNMFVGCTINTTDYNAMLVGWEGQTEPTGINFHGGSSKHSGAGTTARGVLTGTSTWVITDGGAV